MCQYCLEAVSGSSSSDGRNMSLLPLITRLRKFYKRTCCVRKTQHTGINATHTEINLSYLSSLGLLGAPRTTPNVPVTSESSDRVAQQDSSPLLLQKEGIRVLLFRECNTRGRKLLYDSKTVVQVPLGDAAPHASSPVPKALFKGSWGSVGPPAQLPCHKGSAGRTAGQRSDAFAEVSGGYGYQYQQKEGDTKAVGELVFGSVDLAYCGSCSKLHLLQEPPQRVLLSRTAPAPTSHLPRHPAASDPGIEDSSFSSSVSSLSDAAATSGSLEVPWGAGGAHTLAMRVPQCLASSLSEGDSGFGGPPSAYSSTCGSFLSPASVPSTPHGTPSSRQGSGNSLKNSGSLNSLQRRFLRSVNTSLEALGVMEEGGGRGASPSHHSQKRATKLGLAVIMELQGQHHQQESVEDWLFLHLGVIEGAINKLQTALHSAYLHSQSFVSSTHAAVSKLQQDLLDLVSGPRLVRPVWLGLLGQSAVAAERHALCCSFVDTLASVLTAFDTKHTNFFVSKLLTAVLTHHLGWVSTVAPSDPPPLPPPPPSPPATATTATTTTTTTAGSTNQIPALSPPQHSWAERLNESHPYSAVWAQLCELSGTVGYPPRTARTVLLGSNTTLLQHLLTVLSYVIRCSQVVEQQVEAPQGVPSTASALPKHLQGSSQCSSASSIATIVEEVPGLQRDASLRLSRRAARGGARGQEIRGGVGEGTVEQGKDTVEGKRWMLNDGEEIVICVNVGEGGRPFSPASPYPLSSPQAPQGTPQAPPQTTPHTSNLATLSPPAQTLSSSKTSFDLSLVCDEEEMGGDAYLPPAPPSGLYPPLHHLDDHRETFGPVVLEPGKIAEKVQKLFRSSSNRETGTTAHTWTPQPSPQPSQPPQIPLPVPSQSKQPSKVPLTPLVQSSYPALPQQTPGTPAQPSQAPVPPPRTRRSTSKGDIKMTISGGLDTAGLRKVHRDCVIVPAKDIQPEVEEGGKILLLHHNTPPLHYTHTHTNSRLHAHSDSHIHKHARTQPQEPYLQAHSETHIRAHVHGDSQTRTYPQLTPLHTQSDTHIHTHTQLPTPTTHSHSDTHIHTKLGMENSAMRCGGLTRVQGAQVTCLPHPVDTRRRVRLRNVGRESARDLTKLEEESLVYPRLAHPKEMFLPSVKANVQVPRGPQTAGGLGVASCGAREATQTHRRHHSDPTNGVFTTSPVPNLKDVLEEQTESKTPAHPHACREGVAAGVDAGVEVAEIQPAEREGDEQMEMQGQTVTETSKDPVVIDMPKCTYTSTITTTTTSTTTQQYGLAGSLLGGVLDHYASPFILHATTQTQRWEDSLRQDLFSAAHHSPLDPQLAEAVAVVADTDSWEVQVVSSHSYVVGGSGGSSGVVGLRVDASPLISSITDSVLDLTRLGSSPLFIVQHFEELLSELYLKSQLLAQYLLGGAVGGGGGATAAPYHLPDLTRALGLDVNDLPLLLAVASTHTPTLTHMYGLCIR